MSIATAPPRAAPQPPGDLPPEPARPHLWRLALGCLIVLLCAAGASAKFFSGELQTLRSYLSANPSLRVGNALAPAGYGDPQTLLLVGNDQRNHTTTTPVLPHANEMLLVRFDPGKPYVSLMSIPRELMVPIHTRLGVVSTRLNAALTYGGIELLVKTIRQVTGLSVNHVVEIDFNHFMDAVNEIGCVYSTVDRRYYHVNVPGGPQYSQINLQPGYQKLCGPHALQFVSYRHDDTSLVRDARDQSFLLDVKKEYGPTLVDNVHKFERIFGQSVQTDPSLHTTGGILNLIGTLISSSSLRVRQVHFQVTLQPIGANPCACDTATPQQIHASVHSFLHGSSAPPKQRTSQIAKTVHKHAGAAKLPLTPTTGAELGRARSAAQKISFPLEFPRVQDRAGSAIPVALRTYTIPAPGGTSYPIYDAVFGATGLGQFYDVQGTTWTTPPMLDNPDQTVTVGPRTYYLYYEGQHLEVVAWFEHGAAYWVRNTLTQALGNGELLAIAEQTLPATATVGHAAALRAAALPQRLVSQAEYGVTHTLGAIGGLLALVALPLLGIPLLRRRRELAGVRAQLTGLLQVEAKLTPAAVAPGGAVRAPLATKVPLHSAAPVASGPANAGGGPSTGVRPGRDMPPAGVPRIYRSAWRSTRTRVLAAIAALALGVAGAVGIVLNVKGAHATRFRIRHVVATVPSVPVSVLNATTVPGAAGRLARQLHGRGVKIATVGNLSEKLQPGLLILYSPGERGQAEVLAHLLSSRSPAIEPIDPAAQAAAGTGTKLAVVID